MRTLLLFRGSPASGKSTFIKEHKLEQYTLSADNIRLMYQSPVLNEKGNYNISCKNDKEVWKMLFHILEKRMERGEFIVVDATNSKTSEMTKYKKMAEKYRYRIMLIDMTDLPMEECIKRNLLRQPSYKVVPTEVIETQYSRFKTQKIPSGIKVIKPNEFEEAIQFKSIDLSKYDKIHHIGDIHGCYTVLQEYLKEGIKDNEFYIFCGDYCDRGIENAKVLKFLFNIMDKKNVLLLTGNHEIHLQKYANNEISKSRIFEKDTKVELDENNIDKKKLRILYRKLGQVAYYTYNEKTVIVSHGGISNIPKNMLYLATEQLIKGVGDYEDVEVANNSFINNTDKNTYQIHGHRNPYELPTQINDRCYCLEGQVEFGGNLRTVTLSKDGFKVQEIKNNVFKVIKNEIKKIDSSNNNIINMLRDNKYIKEKSFDNISSFNFTSEAFRKGIWNDQTIKARGLFINTKTDNIVIRSYNKFFNINENELTKLNNLQKIFSYPINVYKKYNGYLGLIGYDKEKDELIISSKSALNNEYSEWFKEIFNNKLSNEKIKEVKEFIKTNNCTLVFEVIAPKHDTHIIKYNHSDIILLNIVKNNINFTQFDYKDIIDFANKFGLNYKEKVIVLNNWIEFKKWYDEVTSNDYKYNGEYIEGFVIEDSNLFMTKIKTQYYKFWKSMRNVAKEVYKKGYINKTSMLTTPLSNEFYGWLKNQDKEMLNKDIIELREKFNFVQNKSVVKLMKKRLNK